MKFKVVFTHNVYRTVEADHYVIDDRLIVFMRDCEPVLTCVAANVLFFERVSELVLPLKAQVELFEARL